MKCSSQASESEALPGLNTKGPGVCCSSEAPPADGWGLRMGLFWRKFRESFAKEWAKVKMHFEGGGPASLAKKNCFNQQQPVLTRVSVMLAAGLQGYEEATRDTLLDR